MATQQKMQLRFVHYHRLELEGGTAVLIIEKLE